MIWNLDALGGNSLTCSKGHLSETDRHKVMARVRVGIYTSTFRTNDFSPFSDK